MYKDVKAEVKQGGACILTGDLLRYWSLCPALLSMFIYGAVRT